MTPYLTLAVIEHEQVDYWCHRQVLRGLPCHLSVYINTGSLKWLNLYKHRSLSPPRSKPLICTKSR